MYFKLSASPSEEWKQIFIAERRFPRHTMWREAWVENNFIVIHCVPEELEKYHVSDLKEDIVNANTKYRQYLFEQAQKEIREREQEKDELDKLQNLRKRLDLS